MKSHSPSLLGLGKAFRASRGSWDSWVSLPDPDLGSSPVPPCASAAHPGEGSSTYNITLLPTRPPLELEPGPAFPAPLLAVSGAWVLSHQRAARLQPHHPQLHLRDTVWSLTSLKR